MNHDVRSMQRKDLESELLRLRTLLKIGEQVQMQLGQQVVELTEQLLKENQDGSV